MFVSPTDSTESTIAIRRIAGFALLLSCTAFWDWVVAVVSLPVHIFLWILPVWQCAILAVVALMLLAEILHHSQQGERNRVCERKSKGFSFTDSQQTRFLAVVQDVS